MRLGRDFTLDSIIVTTPRYATVDMFCRHEPIPCQEWLSRFVWGAMGATSIAIATTSRLCCPFASSKASTTSSRKWMEIQLRVLYHMGITRCVDGMEKWGWKVQSCKIKYYETNARVGMVA
jgi:hypothetical protein